MSTFDSTQSDCTQNHDEALMQLPEGVRREREEERRRAIELSAEPATAERNGRWRVEQGDSLMPGQGEVNNEPLPPLDPDHVLARNGEVVHRLQMEWALEQKLMQKIGAPPEWALKDEKIAWHRRQLALLEKADAAPRCEHVYSEGTTCRSPRMKEHKYCYAHARMLAVRPKKLRLQAMEDANSIMLNIMEIQRALVDEEISEKKAGLLLYAMQLGLLAVRGVTFRETEADEMVQSLPAGQAAEDEEDKPVAADLRRGTQIRKKVSRELTRRHANGRRGSGHLDIGTSGHRKSKGPSHRGHGGARRIDGSERKGRGKTGDARNHRRG